MTQPDPSPVLDLIEAFRRSKTMFTAVELGIFDRLHSEPGSAAALSVDMDLNEGALRRLLDGCVGLGLLQRDGDLYQNKEVADVYCRKASERTLAGYILYSNEALYPMWGKLEDAMREGTSRWEQVFGGSKAIFDHFFRTPEARKTFMDGMHGFGLLCSPDVVKIFNLNRFRHFVDLGGGTGHLAITACERYGSMQGTVFDLPQVVEQAKENIAKSRAAARLQTVAGDFFTDPLPPGDLYAVSRILHDWSDAKIAKLLKKIYDALPIGGGLLVAETLLNEDGSGPVHGQMQSLNMLVVTEGRERCASEYHDILKSAGFSDVEARKTGVPLDAVLAIKKE